MLKERFEGANLFPYSFVEIRRFLMAKKPINKGYK